MSSRTRTSPPPVPVAGSSVACSWSMDPGLSVRPAGSLGVDLGLAARGLGAGGGGVAELSGLHLGGCGVGDIGAQRRVVDDREVLRGRLRGDVGVVLTLAVGVEDVGDDLLGLVETLGAGDDGRAGVTARAGGLALVLD